MLDTSILNSSDGTINTNTGSGTQVIMLMPPEKTFSYLDAIIEYVCEQKVSGEKNDQNTNFTEIKEKIRINFDSVESQSEFIARYQRSIETGNLSLIKKYLEQLDAFKREGVIISIQQIFKELVNSEKSDTKIVSFQVLEKLSISIIPETYRLIPEYIATSNYLVLCIFELCDIGLKTSLETQCNFQLTLEM